MSRLLLGSELATGPLPPLEHHIYLADELGGDSLSALFIRACSSLHIAHGCDLGCPRGPRRGRPPSSGIP